MLESQNKIDYTYLGKMCKHFIGRCPALVTLANENGDIIGSAWDLEEDVALFRILPEWQRRGYRYTEPFEISLKAPELDSVEEER